MDTVSIEGVPLLLVDPDTAHPGAHRRGVSEIESGEFPAILSTRSPCSSLRLSSRSHPAGRGALLCTLTQPVAPFGTALRGLAEDVRGYGRWMRDEAERRIGRLYPNAALPDGCQATVVAWLWARTVTCPNPVCRSTMPLLNSFSLSTRRGREAWLRPMPNATARRVRFEVGYGPGRPLGRSVGRNGATCLVCNSPVPLSYVRAEGKAKGSPHD